MKRCLILLVVIGLVFIINGPVHAVTYNYTTVDPAGSTWTVIRGINNSGHMSGNYNDGTYHNFYYDGSSYNDLADPNINFTWGISENDYIAGRYDDASGSHAFMYNGSGYTIIDYPGATFTSAGDVNNSGAVAGRAQIGWEDGEGWGYLYDGVSAFTQLYYPDPGTTWTNANGINNAGHVVGGWWDSSWNEYGYFYDGAGYSPVIYPGSNASRPRGINNNDEMVGRYVDSSGSTHGFYYDGNDYVSIDVPGATFTEAYDINDSGVIVGPYVDSSGTTHGFMATPIEPPFINLPQTGQTASYAAGDDGEMEMGVAWPSPRFTDNTDGTITDELTGLMWAASSYGPESFYNGMSYIAGMNAGTNPNFGYTDWRMPNIREMESLTNAGVANSATWLNGLGFTVDVGLNSMYWVSNAYANNPAEGWAVFLTDGSIRIPNDQTPYYAFPWNQATYTSGNWGVTISFYYLPVRVGANGANDPTYPANIPKTGLLQSYEPNDDGDLKRGVAWPVTCLWDSDTCVTDGRFVDNGDGTLSDNLTRLMWLQDANCMQTNYSGFDNEGIAGDGKVYWQTALDFVAGINNTGGTPGVDYFPLCGAGYTDWRLANKKELWSLLTMGLANPLPGNPETSTSLYLTDQGFTNWADNRIWTSTVFPGDTSSAFFIFSSIRSPTISWSTRATGLFMVAHVRTASPGETCPNLPVRNIDTLVEYSSLQAAYTAAGDGHTLRSHEAVFTEDLDTDQSKSVTLEGGYDCDYSTVTGMTTINGSMTTTLGTVTIGNFILE